MKRSTLAIVLLLLADFSPAIGATEGAETAPAVTLESVTVEPERPAADMLCKLRVAIANAGDAVASQFGFTIRINGQELPVYRNQLFLYPVEAGATAEVPLYNFWSTETSRPMPADGKLNLEVVLEEARWFDISIDDEGVEIWQPIGPVEGLPSARTVVLEMSR